MMSNLLPIVSAWLGNDLSYLERLCLTSMVNSGHEVLLYSYRELKGVPVGVELRDASDIIAEEDFISYNSGSYALGSDLFRYRVFSKMPCIWVDADMFLFKGIQPVGGYVFGWEDLSYINTAVLSLPPNSQVLSEIQQLLSQDPFFAPWWTNDQEKLQKEAIRKGAHLSLAELPWATIGPKLVTYCALRNNVSQYARTPKAFYPVHWRNFELPVTSRQVVWLLLKQLWLEFVPVLHGLQGRFAGQC